MPASTLRPMSPARTSFVCLPCRAAYKQRHPSRPVDGEADRRVCPRCARTLIHVGAAFAAPPRRDTEGWRVLSLLLHAGVRFPMGCCCGPGYRPPARSGRCGSGWRTPGARGAFRQGAGASGPALTPGRSAAAGGVEAGGMDSGRADHAPRRHRNRCRARSPHRRAVTARRAPNPFRSPPTRSCGTWSATSVSCCTCPPPWCSRSRTRPWARGRRTLRVPHGPLGRARRSLDSLQLWVYGGDRAVEEGRRLRRLHKDFRGTDTRDRPYHALNPAPYAWVHATGFPVFLRAARYLFRPFDEQGNGVCTRRRAGSAASSASGSGTCRAPGGVLGLLRRDGP